MDIESKIGEWQITNSVKLEYEQFRALKEIINKILSEEREKWAERDIKDEIKNIVYLGLMGKITTEEMSKQLMKLTGQKLN
jgi:hypothetical protein